MRRWRAEAEPGVAVGGGEAVGGEAVAPLVFLVEAVEGVGLVEGVLAGSGDVGEVEVGGDGVAEGVIVAPEAGLEGGADLEEGAEEGVVRAVGVVGAAPAEAGGEGDAVGEADGAAEDMAGVEAQGVVVGPVAGLVGVAEGVGGAVFGGLAAEPAEGGLGFVEEVGEEDGAGEGVEAELGEVADAGVEGVEGAHEGEAGDPGVLAVLVVGDAQGLGGGADGELVVVLAELGVANLLAGDGDEVAGGEVEALAEADGPAVLVVGGVPVEVLGVLVVGVVGVVEGEAAPLAGAFAEDALGAPGQLLPGADAAFGAEVKDGLAVELAVGFAVTGEGIDVAEAEVGAPVAGVAGKDAPAVVGVEVAVVIGRPEEGKPEEAEGGVAQLDELTVLVAAGAGDGPVPGVRGGVGAGGEGGVAGVEDAVVVAGGAAGRVDGEGAEAKQAGAHEALAGAVVEGDAVAFPDAAGGGDDADVALGVKVAGGAVVGGAVGGEGEVGEADPDVAVKGGALGLLVGPHAVGGDLDVLVGAEAGQGEAEVRGVHAEAAEPRGGEGRRHEEEGRRKQACGEGAGGG